jgi:histidine triad (HIT) family protein
MKKIPGAKTTRVKNIKHFARTAQVVRQAVQTVHSETKQDCLFCKIVRGEIPAIQVYEDTDTFAFLDIHPSAPGHTMVISKKHGTTILEYSPKELGTLMATVQKISQAQEKALICDSISIGINHREETGVYHLHIHLIPRWKNDGGHALQSIVHNQSTNPTKQGLSQVAEKIRAGLSTV